MIVGEDPKATTASLLDLADLVRGVSYTKGEARPRPGPGLVAMLRANNIQDGRLALDDLVYVPQKRVSDAQKIRRGDIVIAMSSGSREVVGKAALVNFEWEGAFGAFCAVLRAKPGILSEVLFHFLQSAAYRAAIERVATGTNINNLSRTTLASIQGPLFDAETQGQLVRLLGRLDDLGRSSHGHLIVARRAIARFRQSVLTAGCSGHLTAQWRDDNPDLARHDFTQDHQGDIEPLMDAPEEWVWSRLMDIAQVRGGIQKGAKLNRMEASREVPYLRVANVQRGWLDLSEMKTIFVPERKITELQLEPGDVLFTEGGDRDKLGRGWIWEGQIDLCIHQNHVFRARLTPPGMQPRFVSWYSNTIGAGYFLAGGKQTVNLASLNMSTLKALPVPVPSPEEQAEIVRRVDQLLTIADEIGRRIEAVERQVERTLQATLAKAFRGDLVPNGA